MPLLLAACRAFLLLAAAAAAAAAAAESTNSSATNCTLRGGDIIRAAFSQVANFPLPLQGRRACSPVRRLHFPSRNLTGAVNWTALANLTGLLTVDLSNNSLHGRIDGGAFWRAPLLRAVDVSGNCLEGFLRFDDDGYPSTRLASLNVSGNRFTSVEGVATGLSGVVDLDLSRNAIGTVPAGLRSLTLVRMLNLSGNHMAGRFPGDLPPLAGVQVLDISRNNFSGEVDAATIARFGNSSFFQAGNALRVIENTAPAPASSSDGGDKHKRAVTIALISAGAAVTAAALAFLAACASTSHHRRRKKKRKDKDKDGRAAVWEDDEVVVGAAKVAAAAPVVLLERPLMELTLADLAAATSGFGRESQLADTGGRSGAAYRAVLPGDLHVIVRVVEGGAVAGVAEDADAAATEAGFRELARLRHPNILPLLGYCIAGNQKLLLYEYMEKGDLHRWLHELPVGSMDTEDICIDAMEAIEDRKPAGDWPTRYRIILGIARGLAFLHQGWTRSGGRRRPIVHGHLVPTNILLGDDMEPRISDFLTTTHGGGGDETATAAGDVYRFGTLVFEVVTGQARWGDAATTSWARGVIRNRKGLNLVDGQLRDETAGTEAETEMAECLQVGFLCTAAAPEKRPTMQQVVGLLKDVRPAPVVPVPQLGSLEYS